MGLFDRDPFDFNGDGRVDGFDTFVGLQLTAGSRREAIELTGDDSFYMGSDDDEEEENLELELAGLDRIDLEFMDEDERREALDDAGLDPDDFDDF